MNKEASIYGKQTRISEWFIYGAIYLSAAFATLLLVFIIVYVAFKGAGVINWEFLTTVTSTLKHTVGIAGNIVNTLYIVVITLLIRQTGQTGKYYRIYHRNSGWNSVYYIRFIWYGVFRRSDRAGIFPSNRIPDSDPYDSSADYQKHTGGPSHGS